MTTAPRLQQNLWDQRNSLLSQSILIACTGRSSSDGKSPRTKQLGFANADVEAHRIIFQVALTGARVFGRATIEAWRQAAASSKYKTAAMNDPRKAASLSSAGLSLDEAYRILNVKPLKRGEADIEQVKEQFMKLFDTNDPRKGGSFYLQSKILRAKERIETEARSVEVEADMERQATDGWNPKIFKDK